MSTKLPRALADAWWANVTSGRSRWADCWGDVSLVQSLLTILAAFALALIWTPIGLVLAICFYSFIWYHCLVAGILSNLKNLYHTRFQVNYRPRWSDWQTSFQIKTCFTGSFMQMMSISTNLAYMYHACLERNKERNCRNIVIISCMCSISVFISIPQPQQGSDWSGLSV